MKKSLINLSLFVLSLIAGVILLEFSIRSILPVYDPKGMLEYKYYPEDDIMFCIKNFTGRQWKNTGDYNVAVSINKYGFRDKRDLLSSRPNDIFVAGDSFSLGWGVEENKRYSDLLESTLGIPVYNISIPAGDLDSYQKLLDYARKNGAKIGNLIVPVCMENDLRDYESGVKNQSGLKPPSQFKKQYKPKRFFYPKFAKVKAWLAKNSATYHAFIAIMHQNSTLQRIAVKLGLIVDNYAGMHKNIYSDKIIASTSRKLLGLSRPFNTTIVVIPSRALWVGDNRKTELEVHNKLISSLRELELNVIDLRPYFEKGGDPLQYHFKNDGHWNGKGHLKAAQIIAKSLSKKY